MKIRRLKIDGFRSFESTELEVFDDQCTLICGINGAGKSGVFEAIKFVLHIPGCKWERSKVVNNNDTRIEQASVTIEIEDDSTPVRLVIRREMTRTGSDTSYLNDKQATESEIHNALSTFGYFVSNPYNIISQNQVVTIANFTDSQRLGLLRNASGVSVYEDKRRSAEQELEQADNELKSVSEYITTITQQREALNKQVKDIELQDKNMSKKDILSAALKTISLNENTVIYDSLQHDIKSNQREKEALTTQLENSKHELVTVELKRSEIRDLIEDKQSLKTTLSSQLETLRADQADIILATEQQKRFNEAQQIIAVIDENIAKENEKITTAESQLAMLNRQLNALNIEYKDVQVDIETAEAIDVLPESDEEAWKRTLSEKIAFTDSEIQKAKSSLADCHQLALDLNEQETAIDIKLEEARASFSVMNDKVMDLEKQELEQEKQIKKDKLANVAVNNQLENAKKQLARLTREQAEQLQSIYSKTIPAVTKGIITLRKITSANNSITGVYGTLMELISNGLDLGIYIPALEAVAGNQLYHIVVDSVSTAKTLVKNLVQSKETVSINFKPLDRLKPRSYTYPDGYIPLVSKLKYNDHFDNAFQDVFGGVIVVKDIEEGVKLSDKHNIDCVTVSGDLIQKNGVIVTASRASSNSRLNAYADLCQIKANITKTNRTIASLASQLVETSLADNSVYLALATARQNLSSQQSLISRLEDDLNELKKSMHQNETDEEAYKAIISQAEAANVKYQTYLEMSYHDLLKTVEKLSSAQQKRTELLNSLDAKHSEIMKTNLNKRAAELAISEYISEKQVNLTVKPPTITISPSQQLELSTDVEKSMASILHELNTLQETFDAVTAQKHELTTQVAKQEQRLSVLDTSFNSLSIQFSEYAAIIDTLKQEIRELDLDEDQEEDVATIVETPDLEAIRDELSIVNVEIAKLPTVSKKAVTECKKLEKELKALTSRREECLRSKQSILSTMETFDAQKQSTLLNEADKLANQFSKIFYELTNTQGSLDVLTENSTLVGLRPNVSFVDTEKNSALSGGQKTLVSIAFIFALQSIEKAPFVILDESDAALDATYRSAVARYIARNENDVQYLITTFSKELLEPCNVVWMIENHSRHSVARFTDKNVALQTIFTSNTE